MSLPLARWQSRLSRSAAGRLLLRALTWPYGAAVAARRGLYRAGVAPSRRVDVKVICFGNLTTGGTGKTSAVLRAAMDMTDRKLRVGILTRGYGRPQKGAPVTVLSDTHRLSWQECGDEAWMMHQVLRDRGVPIFISPNRTQAAHTAMMFKLDALLMDDGFQHFALKRDMDIVCLNALDPFGGGSLLPLGRLREPARGLKRARAVLLTHADKAAPAELSRLKKRLEELNPQAEIVEAAHMPDFFLNLKTHERLGVDAFAGRRVVSLAAIATPEIFEAGLRGLGAEVKQAWRYPDHHAFTPEELHSLDQLKEGLPVITTLKDFPRLPQGWEQLLEGDVFALVIRLEVTKGKQAWKKLLCG